MLSPLFSKFFKAKVALSLLPSFATIVLLVVFSLLWVQPALESLMLDQHKNRIRDLVNVAWTAADGLHQESVSGEISIAEAKDRFIEQFSQVRYGEDLKDYFWVHKLDGDFVFHPYSTSTNSIDHADKNGLKVILEMNRISTEQGEGFLDYFWEGKGNSEVQKAKISFVKYYEPWGWVIGSGFYKDETLAQIRGLSRTFILGMAFFSLIIIGLIGLSVGVKIKTWSRLQQKEKLAREKEIKFENMASTISQGIAIFENNGLVYANKRLCRLLDLNCPPLTPEDLATSETAIRKLVETCEQGQTLEYDSDLQIDVKANWFVDATGNRKYITRRRNEDPENDLVYYLFSDWSLRKSQSNEISQLSKVIEECPLSVVITEPSGTIRYANAFASSSSGYKLTELIGNNPRALKSSRVPSDVYQELWRTITSGNTWQGELLNRSKTGELYWEYAIISPMLDEDGTIEGYYAIKQDITAQKDLEQELRKANKKAKESERIKSAFLDNISHEIRTPLNAISGFLHILDDKLGEDPESAEFSQSIHENVGILLDLVSDILKVSELESSKSFADYDYWNIDELIEEVIDESRLDPQIGIKETIDLRTDFDPNLREKVVFTDQSKLVTIFKELISNAAKFTDEGEIRVGYVARTNQVEFFVSDTGAGISDDEKPQVFNLFHHGQDHYVSLHKGTGLGLNIVKKIIRIMGGSIRFESELGRGTTFYFSDVCEMNPNYLPATKQISGAPEDDRNSKV